MRTLAIDIETYSPLDIVKVGGYRYAENCEVLLFGYAYDGAPVEVIDLTKDKLPPSIVDDLINPEVIKTAYNAQFERTVLSHYIGYDGFLPADQWRCTMILSRTLGMPGSLAGDSEAMRLSEDEAKLATGKALIAYFCKPCRPTKSNGGRTRNMPEDAPDKWAEFIRYNRRDVETERTLRQRMIQFAPSATEQTLYSLDQAINDRGVMLDMPMVRAAIKTDSDYKGRLMARARKLTGLDNPNSAEQLKGWIEEQEGFRPDTITKANVADLQAQCRSASVKEMLDIRQLLAKTSVKKYECMERACCRDGRVHGLLQFYGASRTGRWAGRLVQVQNLPRNSMADLDDARALLKQDAVTLEMCYDNVPDVLSQLIRTAFVARPGCQFIVADFSAIEARVIAWLAREQWRQKVFAEGGDIYCASASQMFHVPVVKHGINGELRQKGKIAELALGYQGSIGALKAMGADRMGLDDEELMSIVAKWRQASPSIVRMWYNIEEAVKEAIDDHCTVGLPHYRLAVAYRKGLLQITLPSGRNISYVRPKLLTNSGKTSIVYEGTEQVSRKWGQLETYGGKLTENIVQATARDCLAVAMTRLEAAGYRIVMHIHDEVVIEHPDAGKLEEVREIMGQPIPWAPELILRADGYTTPYYKKD